MKWSNKEANKWYEETGWIIGFNYLPSTAVNSTEMWQQETYDGKIIKKELRLAADSGFNSCRVFLPFLVWEMQRNKFMENLIDFCNIAGSCGLSVMPVLFDDCAFSGKEPYPGAQDAPRYGVHNSGWTSCPGSKIADDPAKEQILSEYIKSVISTFKNNKQIIVWDLYNEPGNNNRETKCLPLLEKAFQWARAADPIQPLTACIWEFNDGHISKEYNLRFAELSDVISYHDYFPLSESEKIIEKLKKHNRPLLCTEWLHRPAGNTFESHLPLYKRESVGIYNWGLVTGKTQTNLNWDTMTGKPDALPKLWQHDIFYPNGTPYDEEEIRLIRNIE